MCVWGNSVFFDGMALGILTTLQGQSEWAGILGQHDMNSVFCVMCWEVCEKKTISCGGEGSGSWGRGRIWPKYIVWFYFRIFLGYLARSIQLGTCEIPPHPTLNCVLWWCAVGAGNGLSTGDKEPKGKCAFSSEVACFVSVVLNLWLVTSLGSYHITCEIFAYQFIMVAELVMK